MSWQKIYNRQIEKKGGLMPFILSKEKRSAGALIKRIRNSLPVGSKILEIGTGTGAIGSLLTKYGFDVIGIDNDIEMIEIAKKSFALFGKPNHAIHLDANASIKQFGTQSFDCVITHGMLEHYSDQDISTHLKIQLELAPLAICIVPMKSMSQEYRSRGFGDERYLPTQTWKKILQKEFTIKSIYGFGFKETNHKFITEKLLLSNHFARLLAPLCAFNEFWIIQSQ